MCGVGASVVERSRVLHATTCFQEETLSLFSLPHARMDECWAVNIQMHITRAQVQEGESRLLLLLLLWIAGFAVSQWLSSYSQKVAQLPVWRLHDLHMRVCSGQVLQTSSPSPKTLASN